MDKDKSNEHYIRLLAPITPDTANALLQSIDNLLKMKVEKIHLLISSPGGDVSQGIAIHNYLMHLPIELSTYNIGIVDSIGVIIYCAGKNRFCDSRARFLIHNPKLNLQGTFQLDERQLSEFLKSLQNDKENIAGIISDTTGQDINQIMNLMGQPTTFTEKEAKDIGLVNGNSELVIPFGTNITTIGHKSAENIPVPIQIPTMPIPQVPMQQILPPGISVPGLFQQPNFGLNPRK